MNDNGILRHQEAVKQQQKQTSYQNKPKRTRKWTHILNNWIHTYWKIYKRSKPYTHVIKICTRNSKISFDGFLFYFPLNIKIELNWIRSSHKLNAKLQRKSNASEIILEKTQKNWVDFKTFMFNTFLYIYRFWLVYIRPMELQETHS